jgi:L-rhamnose mutarotase
MKLSFLPALDKSISNEFHNLKKLWISNNYHNHSDFHLLVITLIKKSGANYTFFQKSKFNQIYQAWRFLNFDPQKKKLKVWNVINHWGDRISPDINIFRLKNSNAHILFWLSPQREILELKLRLADLFPTILSYWHIIHKRLFLHAAAIVHKKNTYLFVGVSGAGKSTLSVMSSEKGDSVIHDDHVVIYRQKGKDWVVSDTTHAIISKPVAAIFFLVQDKVDQLIPLPAVKSAKGLIKSLQEHGKYILYEDTYKSAFTLCAQIARSIPAYKLHFRKSPDFWRLIDEKFPA